MHDRPPTAQDPETRDLAAVIARLRAGLSASVSGVTVDTLSGDAHEGVFRVRARAGDYALKLSARDADGMHWLARECEAARWGAAQGLGPEVVLALPSEGALVSAYLPDGSLDSVEPASREPATLRRVAGLLRAVHQGPAMNTVADLRGDIDHALGLARPHMTADLRDRLDGVLPAVWEALGRQPATPVPCHNDPHPGNVFRRGDALVLIDWAAAAMGDPGWDLAAFASGAELDDAGRLALYTAYRPDSTPADRERARRWDLLADTYHLAWYLHAPDDDSEVAVRFQRRVRYGLSGLTARP